MNKFILLLLAFLLFNSPVFSCPFCNGQISKGIYNDDFMPNLVVMLSAFIVLGILVYLLALLTSNSHKKGIAKNAERLNPVPLTTASTVLGIGLGGFVDGIVLHQILQWHEMLSNKLTPDNYVNKSINMFWDGIFHAFCLLVVIVGIVLIWKLLKRKDIDTSGRLLSAGLILGWGMFNIVEGVIDHHLLKIHNVFEFTINHGLANYSFLGASIVMIIIGYAMFAKERNIVSNR